jgi:hypothetical protein
MHQTAEQDVSVISWWVIGNLGYVCTCSVLTSTRCCGGADCLRQLLNGAALTRACHRWFQVPGARLPTPRRAQVSRRRPVLLARVVRRQKSFTLTTASLRDSSGLLAQYPQSPSFFHIAITYGFYGEFRDNFAKRRAAGRGRGVL